MTTIRTALVTGGTRGIGKAIALRLARDGFRVALNYARDRGGALRAIEEAKEIAPSAVALQADVTRPEECGRLMEDAARALGPLDVLVNNVGPFFERPLADTSDAEWRQMIDGNQVEAYNLPSGILFHMHREAAAQRPGVLTKVGMDTFVDPRRCGR